MEELKIKFHVRSVSVSPECKKDIEVFEVDGNPFYIDVVLGEKYANSMLNKEIE